MNELDERLAQALGPIPLRSEAERRIGARLRADVEARRAATFSALIHGVFALGALVWGFAAVVA